MAVLIAFDIKNAIGWDVIMGKLKERGTPKYLLNILEKSSTTKES